MISKISLISILALVLLSYGFLVNADDASPIVGGPCAYKQYEGRARITSLTQRTNPRDDSYEVKFRFYPTQKITEAFAHLDGKEHLLLTKRQAYPSASFIQGNGIEIGKEFDCILKVIVKGTCTPTIVEFLSFMD